MYTLYGLMQISDSMWSSHPLPGVLGEEPLQLAAS